MRASPADGNALRADFRQAFFLSYRWTVPKCMCPGNGSVGGAYRLYRLWTDRKDMKKLCSVPGMKGKEKP